MSFKEEWDKFSTEAHDASYFAGWWHDEEGNCLLNDKHVQATKLLLCITEVAEAVEGHRKDSIDDKLPHRTMEEVELADLIIRVGDYAKARNLDVAGAIEEKMKFNLTRPDHQVVQRRAVNGKKY